MISGVAGPLADAITDFVLISAFSTNAQSGPPELGIQFTSNSTSPTGEVLTWEWDFDGDGYYDSSEENPYFVYTVPGIYDVTLRVTDSEDEAVTTLTEYIHVLDPADISGEVAGTWTQTYAPYVVTGNILVNSNSALEIEPGTEIQIQEGVQFEINGGMNIEASWDDPVVLSSDSEWSGLKFMNSTTGAMLKGVEISNVNGSAVFVENSSNITVEDSWIINNTTDQNQGTAYEIRYSENVVVSGNIIANNVNTNLTGGISVLGCDPLIQNNIIVNNGSATALTGAVCIKESAHPVIVNNTIANNLSSGSTIFMFNSHADIMNSIILSESFIFTTIGTLPDVSYTCITGGYSGDGNINADPMFVDVSEGSGPEFNGYEAEWYLTAGSPCIDAGNPDAQYNDVEDPASPGYALYPAMGGLTNDMGAFGGSGMFEYVDAEDGIVDVVVNSTLKAYPNPFNPETNIALNLNSNDAGHPVNLSIFNIKGQLVKSLLSDAVVTSGTSVRWDGTDNTGSAISTGVYFVRMKTAGDVVSSKLMLIK